jgi:Tfp pilus assembly protein PilO
MDVESILAIILIFGGGTTVALGFSPVGRAVADRIRGKHALPETEDLRAELAEQREAQAEELQQVRQEVAELAERLDFAERLLAQQRDPQRLARGSSP